MEGLHMPRCSDLKDILVVYARKQMQVGFFHFRAVCFVKDDKKGKEYQPSYNVPSPYVPMTPKSPVPSTSISLYLVQIGIYNYD